MCACLHSSFLPLSSRQLPYVDPISGFIWFGLSTTLFSTYPINRLISPWKERHLTQSLFLPLALIASHYSYSVYIITRILIRCFESDCACLFLLNSYLPVHSFIRPRSIVLGTSRPRYHSLTFWDLSQAVHMTRIPFWSNHMHENQRSGRDV
jgi:hypothetical protein